MPGKRSRFECEFESTLDTPKGKRPPRSRSADWSPPARNTRSQLKNIQPIDTRQGTSKKLNKKVEFSSNINIIPEPIQGTSSQLLSTFPSPRVVLHRLPNSFDSVTSTTENNSIGNINEDIPPERLNELQQQLEILEQQEIVRQKHINQLDSSINDNHSSDDEYIPRNLTVDRLIAQIRDIVLVTAHIAPTSGQRQLLYCSI